MIVVFTLGQTLFGLFNIGENQLLCKFGILKYLIENSIATRDVPTSFLFFIMKITIISYVVALWINKISTKTANDFFVLLLTTL